MNTRGRPRHPEVLTPRQQEVLALLRRGLTNEEIARELNISPDGVKFHVSDILRRLHVESRHEAAAWQPEPARPRWALLLAPLALVHKIKLSALGYAASAVVIVGAAAGVGLLVWGISRSSRDDAGGASVTIGAGDQRSTGIPGLDATLDLIRAHDVDALMQRVAFQRTPCQPGVELTTFVGRETVQCVQQPLQGTPETSDYTGFSSVPVFSIITCEGLLTTSLGDVRRSVEQAFSLSKTSSIFAVGRGGLTKNADGYQVVVTPGDVTSPNQVSTIWYLTGEARISGLLFECGPTGADQVAVYHGITGDVLPPIYNCAPLPGEYANLMIKVDSLSPGTIKPQFWGAASSTLGPLTGERAIVTVTAATQWAGSVTRLEDVRPGMELQAVGRRQKDCTILAETVLSALVGTPISGPPTSGTIVGQVVQDVDGNGEFSLPDLPGRTLVQLVSADRTFSLYTAADGTFRIVNVPDGPFVLRVWWSPGFVNLSADPANAGLASVPVSVRIKTDEAVSISLPSPIFVKPESSDALPFPADEALAAGPNIATGVLDVGAAPR